MTSTQEYARKFCRSNWSPATLILSMMNMWAAEGYKLVKVGERDGAPQEKKTDAKFAFGDPSLWANCGGNKEGE